MKAELQNKLTKKYSEFFQHLEDHDTPMINPKESFKKSLEKLEKQKSIVVPMQFGIECEDGWYMILDELMGNIKNHIWNENNNRKSKPRSKFAKWVERKRCRFAWKRERLNNFLYWIVNKFPRGIDPMLPIQITQIKEKYGGLNFYYYGGDDYISGLVDFAESISYSICEFCGSTTGVGQTEGWMYTICWNCYEKNEKANQLKWNLRKGKTIYEEKMG
jgi:hypothetical protein